MHLDINKLILKNLNYNEEFCRKVLPFLKSDYFSDRTEKLVFDEINKYVNSYSSIPTFESLVIQLNEQPISEELYNSGIALLSELHENREETVDLEWLTEKTEKFCQEKAIYNAVLESINILDNKHSTLTKGSIPSILSDALAVSFDNSVGHDYINDSENRYDYYHRIEEKIPFSLTYFNKITNGGLPRKTLSIILCPPHKGKSLMMCDFATNYQLQGKNVLYITCEMAEEEIAKRIDANSLNIPMDELMTVPRSTYSAKIEKLKEKTVGRLFIKEYPISTAGVNHFRILLNELRLKKNFVPDVVFVDYLNICISSRVKMSGSVNSYTYIKSIGEELRGLAQEYNIPIVTATQTTRSGANSSDFDMTDVSESFGLAHVADFMIGIINTDELQVLNQIMIKQLKNRFRDMNIDNKFVIGIDKSRMRLYDVENSAQAGITNSNQEEVMETIYAKTFGKKKDFSGITI